MTQRIANEAIDGLTCIRRANSTLVGNGPTGSVDRGTVHESLQAFLANAERGDTWKIRESMKQFYKDLTGDDFK